jgi:Gas vesicle synthesis protein GvpO
VATKKASTSKRAASKESTAKRSPTKKTTTQRSDHSPAAKTGRRSPSSAPRAAAGRATSGAEISDNAVREIRERTGREVESVTSLRRNDEGWSVEVEVLEVARIPDTTDLLALYDVQLDEAGDVQGFHRERRYVRGTPDDG